jgi:Do/DeqQ family serine protease
VLAAPPFPGAHDSYADLVERVAPTVVTIRTEAIVRTDMTSDPFRDFFSGGRRRPPQRRGGLGSGVIASADGYILTNHHVVDGAQRITVELSDRRSFGAELVGSDPPSDLAVLKIESAALPSLPIGDAEGSRVGDVVLAFGNPLGVGQTVTMGIISAKGRATGLGDGYEDFLQTDAPINRGNSGGPLVSLNGELVGINTQILSETGGSIGIGFAIPANMAADVMHQLIETGSVQRGRLGAVAQTITSSLAESLGLDAVRGALVNKVDEEGPAARAGLSRGDVILTVDGKPVQDANDLRNRIARSGPGRTVVVSVDRDGERKQFDVTLARMTPSGTDDRRGASPGGQARYGVTLAPLTPQLASRLGTDAEQGLVVSELDVAGRAAAAGLQRGDVILETNREPVSTGDDLTSALERSDGRPALLLVERQGNLLYLTLETA